MLKLSLFAVASLIAAQTSALHLSKGGDDGDDAPKVDEKVFTSYDAESGVSKKGNSDNKGDESSFPMNKSIPDNCCVLYPIRNFGLTHRRVVKESFTSTRDVDEVWDFDERVKSEPLTICHDGKNLK